MAQQERGLFGIKINTYSSSSSNKAMDDDADDDLPLYLHKITKP